MWLKLRVLLFSFCVLLVCVHCDDNTEAQTSSAQSAPTGLKILLVGIDGATFSIINPMLGKNLLPNFKRLIREGAHGVLRSVEPMLSPCIWNSMVTGRLRRDHGVVSFQQGLNSESRRTLALWNILSAFNMQSGVVGWWTTWPVEKMNGYMVSNHTNCIRKNETETQGCTYPESLHEELRPLIVDPGNPPMDDIEKLIPFTDSERREFVEVKKPIHKHGFSKYKFGHCKQLTYERYALHLLKTRTQPAFLALYLVANDYISHTFWHYYEPEKFEGVDLQKASRLKVVIPNYYQHNDQLIGQLLAHIDENTVVLVLSDHGFRAAGIMPELRTRENFQELREASAKIGQVAVGQSGMHDLRGVFIAWGGPIRRGIEIKARIHDMTPTMLALLGLPVAKDMPGRVLTELVDKEFWQKYPIRYIDSYENRVRKNPTGETATSSDNLLIDELRALGYVE